MTNTIRKTKLDSLPACPDLAGKQVRVGAQPLAATVAHMSDEIAVNTF